MEIIDVRNVNDALKEGIALLSRKGVKEESRAGQVLVAPTPVTTIFRKPQERVLFSRVRDANPFFHLFEACWMLAGRNDARWLDQFVSDFSSRFAEPDGSLHGAYGHRWRHYFGRDQLEEVIKILRADPTSRQCVIQMWDVTAANDLCGNWRDRPCNSNIYLRINAGRLDITVCCRSNDIIWGAYGANAVHFSVLQEYLARRIGVEVGTYYQISNNYHAYLDLWPKMVDVLQEEPVATPPAATPIVTDPLAFDEDLRRFLWDGTKRYPTSQGYANKFFANVAEPLFWTNNCWKRGDRQTALAILAKAPLSDWRYAAYAWLGKRQKKGVPANATK